MKFGMKFKATLILSTILITMLINVNVHAFGTGYSSLPMLPEAKMLSAEFTGVTSTGGGVGLQGRYTHKLNRETTLDAGFGVAAGELDNRFFVGADYEIYPDYMNQPRISLKATFMNSHEYRVRRNVIALRPTISKGFSFWGEEAYPFIAIPVGLSLTGRDKTYESVMSANFGITGRLPIKDFRHLTGQIEAQISLKDSYTGIFFGLGYSL